MDLLYEFPFQWALFAAEIAMLAVLTVTLAGLIKRGTQPDNRGMLRLRGSRGALLVGIVLTVIGLVIGIWGSRYNALIIAGAIMLVITLFLMITGLLSLNKTRR
ncbi:MAG: hypothetical protein BWY11_01487 [Firmicutes bacterium ADurb.Bin182]|nr:MAG: hypothetical protein BWY11_01487 [Firmicutes bacterium ADurb.Bin182]